MCHRNTTDPQATVGWAVDQALNVDTVSSGNMDCWSYASYCEKDGPSPKCKGEWTFVQESNKLTAAQQEAFTAGDLTWNQTNSSIASRFRMMIAGALAMSTPNTVLRRARQVNTGLENAYIMN